MVEGKYVVMKVSKTRENGVNISRRHERNDADSRDIVCVILQL